MSSFGDNICICRGIERTYCSHRPGDCKVPARWNLDTLTHLPWRVGRKVPRNVYAIVGDEPSDADVDIGRMDSAELAAEVVSAHNARLARS